MKRLLVFVTGLIGAIGVLSLATPAYAYPPDQASVTVSDTTVGVGDTVVFSGVALNAFETMTISVTYASSGVTTYFAPRRLPRAVIGTVVTNAEGAWSTNVTLTQAGRATLAAVGNLGTPSLSIQVLVLTSGGSGGGPGLAKTGVNTSAMVLSGIGAVLFGGVLVFGAVRWRRRTNSVDVA